MPSFTLEEIKEYTGCEVIEEKSTKFDNVCTDTRSIMPGMIFLAIKGEKFDGHDFLDKALEKGAAGIILSDRNKAEKVKNKNGTILYVPDTLKAYLDIAGGWRSKFSLPVLAVTGSNGKTTTKDLTAAVLSEKYKVLKTQKNFNSEVGMALTLLALKPEHEVAVIEMGMRGLGQIRNLAEAAKPNIGVILNVGNTHMELLGSIENIAKAKSELAEAIESDGIVILNADNEYTASMAEKTRAGVITFGIKKAADVAAVNIHTEGAARTIFTCKTAEESVELSIPLIGDHNVYDALAAIAAGRAMHLNWEMIARGLNNFVSSGMRFEIFALNDYTVINDAYNASPLSTKAAIENLSVIPAKRRIFVFGDMKELGAAAKAAHEEIGKLCFLKKIDILITLGALAGYAAAAGRLYGMENVSSCRTREDIAVLLKSILKKGDAVLFKGSHSMQMEKIIELLGKRQ
ncbi:UDP-N-acetylmuramoyl-tripeptide--D-alanyl-D-alanine ligase [Pectinatus haikarae]|uniref:UDP-N-acetylmuramoyl-tripeptide--D-alanyl-D-alanine ligase n=1 Tax=Pectinatus haikarae TaxID=349096 RepID=A0ABT9Y6N3_9FIRM|nr:UDP-N-acetylmuramoyl-tripeptide--D-alanyl-D-alanine ligase [Pectinatus haikarae]MDQ0203477.1 UDP-N-acetylmuramoyl-tripeptide--D-alanyl-D-alanine ligase [Pectinatus haikarae]